MASVARHTSSTAAPHALAYRNALQVAASREIAILVQPLVTAEVSGVLFTWDPGTGADELVVEAARGLGDVVVGGLVTPDRSRVRADGAIIERRPGHRSGAIVRRDRQRQERTGAGARLAGTGESPRHAMSGMTNSCQSLSGCRQSKA